MTTANTFIEEDGFGLVERPDYNISPSSRRCYETVRRYTMTNKGNSSVRLITWGAGIQSIKVPNDKGTIGDVVLGYDSMDGYLKINRCSENVVGTMINLVSPTNDEGRQKLDNVNWESYVLGKEVVMSNLSNSSAYGWPGDMLTQVRFSWTDDNELRLNIRASSTGPVPSNITTRCLLNLAGHGTGPGELRNHVVTLNASKWTFTDVGDKVPTGAIIPVDSTVYDLRRPTRLTKERLRQVPGGGYDQNLCVDAPSSWCYRFHGRILHPGSGRFVEVYSNQPGVRFYTGNDLPEPGWTLPPNIDGCCRGDCGDRRNSNSSLSKTPYEAHPNIHAHFKPVEEISGKDGVLYRRHGGFGISPQNYPNAINTEGFPTCVLYPGKIYAHDMAYKFGTVRKI